MDFSIARTGKWFLLACALLSGALLPGCSCEDEVGYKKAVDEMIRLEKDLSAVRGDVAALAEFAKRPEGVEPSWLYNQISRHESTLRHGAARIQAISTYDIPQDRARIQNTRKRLHKRISDIRKELEGIRGYRPQPAEPAEAAPKVETPGEPPKESPKE